MELIEGTGGSRPVVPITIILGSVAFLTLSIVAGLPVKVLAP